MKNKEEDHIIELNHYERIIGFFTDSELNKDIMRFNFIKRGAISGNRTEAQHKLIILDNEKKRRTIITKRFENAKK